MLNDWVLYKLCGEMRSEVTSASGSGILEIAAQQWSPRIQRTFDLDQSLFPPVARAGEVIGAVLPETGIETGLKPGTPVVVSGADTQCALLGAGMWGPDQTGIVSGTTAMVCRSMDSPYVDPEKRLWTSCHMESRSWILEANAQLAGSVLQWIRDLMAHAFQPGFKDVDIFAWMEKKASYIPPGSAEAYAFLGPIIMDQENFVGLRPGVFFFPPPAHPMTTSPVRAGHFFRALLENIAFAMRGNLEQIRSVKPYEPDRIFLTGGLAKSRLFCQILSDCLELPVFVGQIYEASALGSAICAAQGIGAFSSLEAAQKECVQMDTVISPNKENAEVYQPAYARWKELYHKIGEI